MFRKIFLVLFIFFILGSSCALATGGALKLLGDMSYNQKEFEEAVMYYYGAYLDDEINRDSAVDLVNKARIKLGNDYGYFSKTKDSDSIPNIMIDTSDKLDIKNYTIYIVMITNVSNKKMILNGAMTKGIGITQDGQQKYALDIFDIPNHTILNKLQENMISNQKIYPGASLSFILIFSGKMSLQKIYLDSLYYEDNSKEEVLIDFLKK